MIKEIHITNILQIYYKSELKQPNFPYLSVFASNYAFKQILTNIFFSFYHFFVGNIRYLALINIVNFKMAVLNCIRTADDRRSLETFLAFGVWFVCYFPDQLGTFKLNIVIHYAPMTKSFSSMFCNYDLFNC